MSSAARRVALQSLIVFETRGNWSEHTFRATVNAAALDSRDAGLCTRLVNGVLQNRILLDWHLNRVSSVPVEKMNTIVRNSLRMGLYQLLFLDRVPAYATVNESVALLRERGGNPRAAKLVNAVLRLLAANRDTKRLAKPAKLSVRYSHPQWLVDTFSALLPSKEVESLLRADNETPPVTIQTNTGKTTTAALLRELSDTGITVQEHPWLPDCLELWEAGALERLPAFREGRFYVQDAAAKLAVLAAAPLPGMTVLDACAAPGGKSFAAAIQMAGTGSVLSCELHSRKCELIQEGAARLGLSCISTAEMDARAFHPAMEGKFDLVIADVPCSGLGVIRKKPDIRYKNPALLQALPEIQRTILNNVSHYVRPGGVLLYATCTVLRQENEEVVETFLEEHKAFHPEPFSVPGSPIETAEGAKGMATLWPHRHGTDGFFFAKLRKSWEAALE